MHKSFIDFLNTHLQEAWLFVSKKQIYSKYIIFRNSKVKADIDRSHQQQVEVISIQAEEKKKHKKLIQELQQHNSLGSFRSGTLGVITVKYTLINAYNLSSLFKDGGKDVWKLSKS